MIKPYKTMETASESPTSRSLFTEQQKRNTNFEKLSESSLSCAKENNNNNPYICRTVEEKLGRERERS
jgi:hypothetical protein